MGHWIREAAGWLLMAAGLLGFWFLLGLIANQQPVEAAILASGSIFLFRGGLQLVKLSVAARILAHAARQEVPARR